MSPKNCAYLSFLLNLSVLLKNSQSHEDKLLVEKDEVSFYITSRDNDDIELTPDNLHRLSPTLSTKFIIHGWIGSRTEPWVKHLSQTLMRKGPFNVIKVSWFRPASQDSDTAALSVPGVGFYLGTFVNELRKKRLITLRDTHLIGFSYGAHVAGFAGKIVKRLSGAKVARITGLDPENRIFGNVTYPDGRLWRNDAMLVDVIHTDGGERGILEPLGRVDFFANGGVRPQPGCLMESFPGCSHTRACELFAEAVENDKAFVSLQCDSLKSLKRGACNGNKYVTMGSDLDPTAEGSFYFQTNGQPPYSIDYDLKNFNK